ncbi:MAG: serine protease [Candidatus Methylopumilus sp.]|nr:serine protease [Candidatus Methylopumilus sp.]
MNTQVVLCGIALLCVVNISIAQPDIEHQLLLHDSMVQISSELDHGSTGTGTGVVITPEYVATNCHILANTKGVSINKNGDAFKPTAIKADWKHDLCMLKFDPLPFKPVKMRDSSTLKYEEEVFSVGYPIGFNVPQSSFGSVKAIYPFDGSFIIRTSASFGLGSSGGALFDQQFNLIGITSFKSPGPQGYFYSMPVEWIKNTMKSKEVFTLNTNEVPFWALEETKRPYFMRVVIPYQNHDWLELKRLASEWSTLESNNSDSWYFLGVSEYESNDLSHAKLHLSKATQINSRHLDALVLLAQLAFKEKDLTSFQKIKDAVKNIDEDEYNALEKQTK